MDDVKKAISNQHTVRVQHRHYTCNMANVAAQTSVRAGLVVHSDIELSNQTIRFTLKEN